VWHENLRRDIDQETVPGATFLDLARENASFRQLSAYTPGLANLTGRDRPEQLEVMTVTPDYFETLGVQPALGRGFGPDEGTPGSDRVVVLQHDYWATRLLGDPDVLGETLVLDGTPHTVIGVMGEAFDPLPANADLFRPSDFRDRADDRAGPGLIVVGRLGPGVGPAEAERDLGGIQARLTAEHPDELEGWTLDVVSARDLIPGPTDRRLALILMAVTLFGLVIACANVANLLLARAETRTKEVAIRTAMGAERGRVLRQLLTESVVLAVGAGAVGVVGSRWLLAAFRTAFPPEIPDVFIPTLRPLTLGAVLLVTLGSGVLFGLAPALSVIRSDLRSILGEESRGGTAGRGRRRLRNAFVVGEFAVALALLTGAAFLGKAFQDLIALDGGFRSEGVLTFTVTLPETRYADDVSLVRFQEEAVDALQGLPAVHRAAAMTSLPRSRRTGWASYEIEGRPVATPSDRPEAVREVVSPGWFDLLDVDVGEGRALAPSDRADAPLVAVVNRAFVAREFPDGDALGRRIVVDDQPREIVGVAANVLHSRIPEAGEDAEPAVYLPMAQNPRRGFTLAVHHTGDPAALTGPVRDAMASVDPDQPVGDVQTLGSVVSASLAGPRVIALFLGVIGVVALALAAMGIYGVLAHAVALQRRELGIRMALGADRASVLGMVARNGLGLVGLGLLAGTPLAAGMFLAASRALTGLSEVVSPLPAFAAIGGSLALVALLACLIPAVRATRVDPARALAD
ncbi:MAG: ABC transporter permease, partial [Gemmatimonadota bacterium]|jgi:putative ABC transport system permease protein